MHLAVNIRGIPHLAKNERDMGHPSSVREPEADPSASGGWSEDGGATYDLNQRITRDPFQSHAGAGRSFAGRKIRPVDFVQSVVLRFMGVEPCLARRHRHTVSQRETEKNLQV